MPFRMDDYEPIESFLAFQSIPEGTRHVHVHASPRSQPLQRPARTHRSVAPRAFGRAGAGSHRGKRPQSARRQDPRRQRRACEAPVAARAGHRHGGCRRSGRRGRHRVQGWRRSVWNDGRRRRHPGIARAVRGGRREPPRQEARESLDARGGRAAARVRHGVFGDRRSRPPASGTDGARAGRRGRRGTRRRATGARARRDGLGHGQHARSGYRRAARRHADRLPRAIGRTVRRVCSRGARGSIWSWIPWAARRSTPRSPR